MMNTIVGIDIAKQKFDVAFTLDEKKWHHHIFFNTKEGYQELLNWLKEKGVSSIHGILEATGRYGEDLAEYLYNAGHKVTILNPAQIKAYSRSLLSRSKTDKVDSKLIAEFGRRHPLENWKPLTGNMKKLKEWVRCLESFKKDHTQAGNRLKETKDTETVNLLTERLEHINKQIKKLEKMIRELIKDTKNLQQPAQFLLSIPGIGETTVWGLLGELPDLQNFNCAKQLSAYAGLNPTIRSSGSSVRGKSRLSNVGGSHLRKLLFFPAMTAIRVNALVKQLSDKLKARGKKPMVIIGAAMRKLIHIIFGVLKK